jgi:hypothetical protein
VSKYHVTQAKQDLEIKSLMETLIASNSVAVLRGRDTVDDALIVAYDNLVSGYGAYRNAVCATKEVLQERGELI